MRDMSRWLNRVFCALGLLAAALLLSVSLPVSKARWVVVLSDEGSVQVGGWMLTSTPTGPNCTFTQGYWKNHPEAWPVEEIVIGGVTYDKEAALALLQTEIKNDATYNLAHQLIAAKLNILNGADPAAVAEVIAQADAWLEQHPLGSRPKNPARQTGVALAAALDDYNNGVSGPGYCEDGDAPLLGSEGSGMSAESLAVEPPTAEPAIEMPTPKPAIEQPTSNPTAEPTLVQPTVEPTVELPTPEPTLELPPPEPTLELPTAGPTAEPPIVEPELEPAEGE